MVYHIGPLLPSSQTTKLKPTGRVGNTDLSVSKQKLSFSEAPLVERRKHDRRKSSKQSLFNHRANRDRRKNGQPGGFEVKV